MKSNFLIVGLGNPGEKYKDTRHNIGFEVLDYISHIFELKKKKYNLYLLSERFFINKNYKVKAFFMYPLTYMNNSGLALKDFFRFNDINKFEIVVIHDDIDMKLGKIKIKKKSGHGGHNGVKSIIEHIGSEKFIKIKIGIDRPSTKELIPDYVLGKFTLNEKKIIKNTIKKVADLTVKLFFNPIEKVQSCIIN